MMKTLNISLKQIDEKEKASNKYVDRLINLMHLYDISIKQVSDILDKEFNDNMGSEYQEHYFKKLTKRHHVKKNTVIPYANVFIDIVQKMKNELEYKTPKGIKEYLLSISSFLDTEVITSNDKYEEFQERVYKALQEWDGTKFEKAEPLHMAYNKAEKILKENGIIFEFGLHIGDIPRDENEKLNLYTDNLKSDEIYRIVEKKFLELDLSICYLLVHNWNDFKRILQDEIKVELLSLLIAEPVDTLNSIITELKESKVPNKEIIDNAIEYAYILNLFYQIPFNISSSHESLWKLFKKELELSSDIIVENFYNYFDSIIKVDWSIMKFLFIYLCTNCDYAISEEDELIIIMPQ